MTVNLPKAASPPVIKELGFQHLSTNKGKKEKKQEEVDDTQ